jgi:hypothetical protein
VRNTDLGGGTGLHHVPLEHGEKLILFAVEVCVYGSFADFSFDGNVGHSSTGIAFLSKDLGSSFDDSMSSKNIVKKCEGNNLT